MSTTAINRLKPLTRAPFKTAKNYMKWFSSKKDQHKLCSLTIPSERERLRKIKP